jgi:beta-xylosidase
MFIYQSSSIHGPWTEVQHKFDNMAWQWAPNFYKDKDGSIYLYANNWIQKVNNEMTSFIGGRLEVVKGTLLENPSLFFSHTMYYWVQSQNGTDKMGVTESDAKITVWKSKNITGPYLESKDLLLGNLRWQGPNTGSVVEVNNDEWWYCYNTWDMLRLAMCRQFHLDKLEWNKSGWPEINGNNGPSTTFRKPVKSITNNFLPDMTDEFNGQKLEGIDTLSLGSKWLFRNEMRDAWSLSKEKGKISLKALYPGFDSQESPNFLAQRPSSAYYTVETKLYIKPKSVFEKSGLAIKEFCSKNGIYITLESDYFFMKDTSFVLKVWHCSQSKFKEVEKMPLLFDSDNNSICLKINMNGLEAEAFYSYDGKSWKKLGGEYGFNWEKGMEWNRYWTSFMPAIFSGSKILNPGSGEAYFDYFRIRHAGN